MLSYRQSGDSVFAVAVKNSRHDFARQILELGASKPPGLLHHVIRTSKDLEMATWMITVGYDVEALDEVRYLLAPT